MDDSSTCDRHAGRWRGDCPDCARITALCADLERVTAERDKSMLTNDGLAQFRALREERDALVAVLDEVRALANNAAGFALGTFLLAVRALLARAPADGDT